jgi:hypothetical protein
MAKSGTSDSGKGGGSGGGKDDPIDHDVGDDKGVDDPATHDIGDDHGVDDPLIHDVGDDHGHGGAEIELHTPRVGEDTVAVWRFHDPASDVYFWTTNTALKDDLLTSHPELGFDGEAFRAYADDKSGGHKAIGVVWDQGAGPYGNFIYQPAEDAVKLAGQSDSDDLVYLGVAFWI